MNSYLAEYENGLSRVFYSREFTVQNLNLKQLDMPQEGLRSIANISRLRVFRDGKRSIQEEGT